MPGILYKPQLRRQLLRYRVLSLDHAGDPLASVDFIEPRQTCAHRFSGHALAPVVGVNNPAGLGHIGEPVNDAD